MSVAQPNDRCPWNSEKKQREQDNQMILESQVETKSAQGTYVGWAACGFLLKLELGRLVIWMVTMGDGC